MRRSKGPGRGEVHARPRRVRNEDRGQRRRRHHRAEPGHARGVQGHRARGGTEAVCSSEGSPGPERNWWPARIYQYGLRADKPLIVVNCAATSATPAGERVVRPRTRGSFTGAIGERIGKLREQASEGTLFLDEIGDIPWGVQAKILRVLQDRSFRRGRQRDDGAATPVCWLPRIETWRRRSPQTYSARTFSTVSTSSASSSPRCEKGPPTYPNSWITSCTDSRGAANRQAGVVRGSDGGLADLFVARQVRRAQHCIQRLMISTGGHPIQAADISSLWRHTDHAPLAVCGPLTMKCSATWSVAISVRSRRSGSRTLPAKSRDLAYHRGSSPHERGTRPQASRLLGLPRQTLNGKFQKYRLAAEGGALQG